ncbi:alpha-ketoglutarate-dependent dioxygenase AlkB [Nocardioides lentus]|uniref:alpha-ketoglutarate-dependent dioxygenase AlkB n=1 Tax=Nocardioides lentus TaxID=338077 RepID=UPI0031DB4FF5
MDVQGSLFAEAPADRRPAPERRVLSSGAWIDVARSWLTEPDGVFDALVSRVPWRAERREMYDRVVAVPRLLHTYGAGEALPHPALLAAREALDAQYAAELGERFATAGCCFYRDGRDSVAWHGDRIGRGATHDTMVAIVSVGDPRRLALRPRGGGPSIAVEMGHGDLVVMGGSCQRTWEHAVPKAAHAGPRVSVQFRPRGVL